MVTPNLFQSQVIYVTCFPNHGISITIFCIHLYLHCTYMCTEFVFGVLSHLDHSNLVESLTITGIHFLSGWNCAVDPIIKASLCESDAIGAHCLNSSTIPEYLGLSIAESPVLFSVRGNLAMKEIIGKCHWMHHNRLFFGRLLGGYFSHWWKRPLANFTFFLRRM